MLLFIEHDRMYGHTTGLIERGGDSECGRDDASTWNIPTRKCVRGKAKKQKKVS